MALDLKPAAQHSCQTNAATTPAAAPSATSCHHRCLVAVASSRVSFYSANIFCVPTISAVKFSLKFSVAPTLTITHSLVNAASKEVDSWHASSTKVQIQIPQPERAQVDAWSHASSSSSEACPTLRSSITQGSTTCPTSPTAARYFAIDRPGGACWHGPLPTESTLFASRNRCGPLLDGWNVAVSGLRQKDPYFLY